MMFSSNLLALINLKTTNSDILDALIKHEF